MSIQHELQRSQKEWYTQGKEDTRNDFIKGMAADELSVERIAKISHLTVEEVEEIISSKKDDSKQD